LGKRLVLNEWNLMEQVYHIPNQMAIWISSRPLFGYQSRSNWKCSSIWHKHVSDKI